MRFTWGLCVSKTRWASHSVAAWLDTVGEFKQPEAIWVQSGFRIVAMLAAAVLSIFSLAEACQMPNAVTAVLTDSTNWPTSAGIAVLGSYAYAALA